VLKYAIPAIRNSDFLTGNRICEKCFSDEIESEKHLLLKCSFYYASRRKLLETIKNNINHSNLEKLSFGVKFI
jgi:hypothetical protein